MHRTKHTPALMMLLLVFLMSGGSSFAQNSGKSNPVTSSFETRKDVPTVIQTDVLGLFDNISITTNINDNNNDGRSNDNAVTPGIDSALGAQVVSASQTLGISAIDGLSTTSSTTTTTNCPLMYVDVDIPFLQSCLTTSADISFCNHGTADATNTYVDVTLDAELALDSASVPYTLVGVNTYRFQLGTVLTTTCGTVEVFFTTACDSALINDEHCIQAHIYPDTTCASAWNNYLLNIDGECNDTSIVFGLINLGAPIHVTQQLYFVVIEDHLLVQGGGNVIHQGVVELGTGQTMGRGILNIQAASYKMEVRDAAGNVIVSSTVQNCSPTTTGLVSNYHAQSYWNGGTVPSLDEGCAINGYSPSQNNSSLNPTNGGDGNGLGSANNATNDNDDSAFDKFEEATTIKVFPNPFDQYTTIQIDGPIAEEFSFKLYDVTGRVVQMKNLSEVTSFEVERGALLNGMYFYQIEAEGELIGAGKLVIK